MNNIALYGIILTNVFLILGFIIGKISLIKFPNAVKFFAYFSVLMCAMFIFYFIFLLWFSIANLFGGKIIYSVIFPLFIFLPFVIGHFTSYEKLHFYTNIQIGVLIGSLVLAVSYI